MENDFPLTNRLTRLDRYRLGVVLLLITILATPAINYLPHLVETGEEQQSEPASSIYYIVDAGLFLNVLLYVWSILCLSHRPDSEVGSISRGPVRFWARVLAVAVLALYLLLLYGSLKLMTPVEIGGPHGKPAWLKCYIVLGHVSFAVKTASFVFALLCLGSLRTIVNKTRLFALNGFLIWMVILSGLFTLGSRVYYTVLTWTPRPAHSRADLDSYRLSETLQECSAAIGLVLLVFEIVLLILFTIFISRARARTLVNGLPGSR